jgi:ubiquinone biosynthesis protein Coq4
MQDWQTKFVLWLARLINPPVSIKQPICIELEVLRQLPEGTLGRELARFLDDNHFTPFESGDLIQRTHDIWHVLTGLSACEYDELVLQAFTRAQVFRPSSAVFVIYGLVCGKLKLRDVMDALRRGRMSQRIVHWMQSDIQSDWEMPLSEVRKKLGIIPFHASSTEGYAASAGTHMSKFKEQ